MDNSPNEFVRLLTAAQSILYKHIYALTFNHDATRELLQQTNLVIWEHRHEFQEGTNFNAWAAKISHYQVLNWRKKQKRNRLVTGDHLFELMSAEFAGIYDSSKGDHQHSNDLETIRLEALKDCIQQLPDHHRECLNQRYREGDTVRAIADKLHKTENSISQLLARIKSSLADCITKKTNKIS